MQHKVNGKIVAIMAASVTGIGIGSFSQGTLLAPRVLQQISTAQVVHAATDVNAENGVQSSSSTVADSAKSPDTTTSFATDTNTVAANATDSVPAKVATADSKNTTTPASQTMTPETAAANKAAPTDALKTTSDAGTASTPTTTTQTTKPATANSDATKPATVPTITKEPLTQQAEDFTNQSNFNIEEKAPDHGGESLGGTWSASNASYDFNFGQDGQYNVALRIAVGRDGTTKGLLKAYLDDKKAATLNLTSTGGWGDEESQWSTVNFTINALQGKHTLKLQATDWGFNLDDFTISYTGAYVAPVAPTFAKSDAPVVVNDGVTGTVSSTDKSKSQDWYKADQGVTDKNTTLTPVDITKADATKVTTLYVDPNNLGQAFLGIGTSLEPSSVYNIAQLSPDARYQFLKNLVDPVNGEGMTLFRICIGTPDFTGTQFYTYYDQAPADPTKPDWYNTTGHGFSIQNDIDNGIVSTIQELLKAAKDCGVQDQVKLFASSWTAPGWMKVADDSSESAAFQPNDKLLKGGKLNDADIDNLAEYYVRYLEEYAKQGIPIYGLTLQNEPLVEIQYPSMNVTPAQEAALAIKVRELAANSAILKQYGISDPKIWAFDHNFDSAEQYVDDMVAANPDVLKAINGVAIHDYSGNPSVMQTVYDKYKGQIPDMTVNLTERSVWGSQGADRIIQYLRDGSVSYDSWVTMLDSNIGPMQWVGVPDPSLFVRKSGSSTEYWSTPEVYMMAQFGRYIRPGMQIVKSDYGDPDKVTDVVYYDAKNDEYVAVVVNQSDDPQQFKFVIGDAQFMAVLPSQQIATYTWHGEKTAKQSLETSLQNALTKMGNSKDNAALAEARTAVSAAYAILGNNDSGIAQTMLAAQAIDAAVSKLTPDETSTGTATNAHSGSVVVTTGSSTKPGSGATELLPTALSTTTSKQNLKSTSNMITASPKSSNKRLPKTGDAVSSALAVIGVAMMSLLGTLGFRKRAR